MNPEIKRYVVSSAVTFTSVFLVALGVSVESMGATEAITGSAVVALLLAAARAALKVTIEQLTAKLQKKTTEEFIEL